METKQGFPFCILLSSLFYFWVQCTCLRFLLPYLPTFHLSWHKCQAHSVAWAFPADSPPHLSFADIIPSKYLALVTGSQCVLLGWPNKYSCGICKTQCGLCSRGNSPSILSVLHFHIARAGRGEGKEDKECLLLSSLDLGCQLFIGIVWESQLLWLCGKSGPWDYRRPWSCRKLILEVASSTRTKEVLLPGGSLAREGRVIPRAIWK